jgi:hypothetical protein
MDFDKCHHLSRNVKLIFKILSDLEPLRGSSNKKTLYSTRSCDNWAFLAHVGQPNLHKNSSNKLLCTYYAINVMNVQNAVPRFFHKLEFVPKRSLHAH